MAEAAEALANAATEVAPELLNQAERLVEDLVAQATAEDDGVVRTAQISALARVALLAALADASKEELEATVAMARQEDLSWAKIGLAAQIAPQVAQRRWDPKAKAKHAEYQRSRRQKSGT